MPALFPVLRLLRVGTLFSPAADVTASLAVLGLPWDRDAVAAVAASVLLYAAGMVWNDVADRRLDAVQRPERPLPRGDVSLAFAAGLGVALLAAAIALSPCRQHHGLLAVLVLLYDFAGKRFDWGGALLMGGLRALNLGTALALPAAMAEADAGAGASLRLACACYGLYIVAVTVLGIFEDASGVRPRAIAAVQTAPPIAALAGIAVVQEGPWPAPVLAAVPALWFLRRNARRTTWDQAALRASMTLLLLGTMLYTGALAFAAGRTWEALAIVAAIVPARQIARRIQLT
ncbi:MAG: UbiA family prenyltransferase [Planctomycetes bacterium]|nr:UbiA family prenyltransferase [Planctomycetota bacterium]